jgi:hypothetical protein
MVYKHISFAMEDMALPVFKYAYIQCKTTESITWSTFIIDKIL